MNELISLPARAEPNCELDDDTKALFRYFRQVFGKDNQLERMVFWAEEQRSQVILRLVQNLHRQKKNDDYLVGRAGNSLDSARVAIGNFAAGAGLSTVRWELYSDFGLTQLVDYGRFDFGDLLPDLECFAEVAKKGVQIVGDWDFDSIILSHQCKNCQGIYNRESIIYVPHFKCETCGKIPTFSQSRDIIHQMIKKFRRRLEITAHYRLANSDQTEIQFFIDPLPNSILYWWATSYLARTRKDPGSVFPIEFQMPIRQAYQASLFKTMAIPAMRKDFKKYLKKIGEKDWELFMGQMRIFGELFNAGDLKYDHDRFQGISAEYVMYAMPLLINNVISGTYWSQKQTPSQEKGG